MKSAFMRFCEQVNALERARCDRVNTTPGLGIRINYQPFGEVLLERYFDGGLDARAAYRAIRTHHEVDAKVRELAA